MTITITPSRVAQDATALVLYQGTPDRAVAWALSGPGTLTPITTFTDRNGYAAAKYTPGAAGDTATIIVVAGA